jgi:predicted porin
MKRKISRSLLAAALSLVGAAAHAQVPAVGSVTLFGILDAYAGKSQLAGRASTSVLNPSALTTSRWGVIGSEDLGGGLRANFYLVALLRPDTGAPGRFDGDAFWSSRSTVGLSGSFGQVNLGRMNSPLFFALLRFDAHELGGQTPLFLQTYPGGQPLVAPQLVPDSTMNNGIQYATPNWAGFSATVHASAGETVGHTNGRTGFSANYTAGPLSLGLATDSINTQLVAGETHQSARMAAASYDFSVVKLSAIYQLHKQSTLGNEYRISTLGATVPLGANKVLFSWSHTLLDRRVGTDPKRDTVALTYDHFLSKRTDLYVHAMVDKLTDTSRGNTLLAGMRHRF